MTKHAGITFRGKSFWVYDAVGGIFLWHLVQAAEAYQSRGSAPWLEKSIKKWRVAAIVTELAYYADDKWTQEQVDLVIGFSRDAVTAIRKHGDFTRDEVTSWPILKDKEIFTRGLDPVPFKPIVLFAEAFISLLLEELPAPPDLHWWFYGTEDPPLTIKMAVNYDGSVP